jgi:hypothetical protein
MKQQNSQLPQNHQPTKPSEQPTWKSQTHTLQQPTSPENQKTQRKEAPPQQG